MQQVWDLGRYPTESTNRSLTERQLAERLRRALNGGKLSPEHVASLGKLVEGAAEVGQVAGRQALQRAGLRPLPEAEARIAKAGELMQQVRDFGRCPKENERCSLAERQAARRRLAGNLRWARQTELSLTLLLQEAELQALEARKFQQRAAARIAKAEEVMQQVRDIGRCGKENERCSLSERALAAKLRKARKAKLLSPEQEAELQALQARKFEQRAAARIAKAEEVMQEVRDLGRYPKRTRRSTVEGKLAIDVFTARRFKQFSPEQEAELETFKQAESHAREAARIADVERMMQEVRSLRRYPKEGARRSVAEQQLAEKLRHARKAKKFSPEQEAELKALQQVEMDSSEKARENEHNAACYQKNKARLAAKQKEYYASPHGKARRKEYNATPQRKAWRKKYSVSPHGKARRKEQNAAYYQKNKARIVAKSTAYFQKHRAERNEYSRKYWATPHSKAKKKEYDAQRRATPHGKARQKEYNVAYRQKNKARIVVKKKEYYQKNKARIAAKQKENQRKDRATPHSKAKKKEYDAQRRATPHGKARQKEYNVAYYQKNKARIVAKRKEYNATPHGKVKKLERQLRYLATPHGKARKKEYNAKRRASPHGKAKQKEYERRYEATAHGKARRKEYERKTSAEDHERKGASHLTVRSASVEEKPGARRLCG